MDVETTDGLFHVSFGIMRQLGKDLPSQWSHQNHSDSPIWMTSVREGFPYSWFGGYRMVP